MFNSHTANLVLDHGRRWIPLCAPSLPVWYKCADEGKQTSRYRESSAWSEWECWPPLGPWSQLCLSPLNLRGSFPPPHCPFDDALGKAKRPASSRLCSVKELGRFLLFSLSKDEKAKGLDLIEGPQLERDWESCSSAFKSNCSSRRRGKMRLERNAAGGRSSEGQWLCLQQNRTENGERVMCWGSDGGTENGYK